jgi:hypothetical protein
MMYSLSTTHGRPMLRRALGVLLGFSAMACGAADNDVANEETVAARAEAIGTGSMRNGEYLFTGQSLYSANCAFRLQMEGSGHLAASYTNGGAFWSSNS